MFKMGSAQDSSQGQFKVGVGGGGGYDDGVQVVVAVVGGV